MRSALRREDAATVAVVVPISNRQEFLPDEELSLRHLCHYLGAYDKYLIAPAGSPVRRDGFTTRYVPRKFFGSPPAHGNLMMWRPFYESFRSYQYIFLHHLDSLVFSDDLLSWCRAGYDFIGPPWVPCRDTPLVTEARVGNSGCALFRIASVCRVLQARHRREPRTRVVDLIARNNERLEPVYGLLARVQRWRPHPFVERILQHRARTRDPLAYGTCTDQFWSREARRYLPSFRVASVAEALGFAFEAAPRECFERNGRRLPFGCHAWAKYDRAFWEPFLLRE
jgi:hypothetical protein